MSGPYAHTLADAAEDRWQPLEEHLRNVGELAARFAASFGAADWARLAGRWHDLGKYSAAFQSYLRAGKAGDPHLAETTGRVDHSTAGAQHAAQAIDVLGHLLAYVIAGHHGGLPDGRAEGTCLESRLRKTIEPWDSADRLLTECGPPGEPSIVRAALATRDASSAFTIAFFTRMLFSCLVDADFLDTERFMDRSRSLTRPTWPDDVLPRMEAAVDGFVRGLRNPGSPVGAQREHVRQACVAAAALRPGLFSLTVPTGGGKTFSSLAFALRHATLHGLRRVVYVAPFTTIIEQNAGVFRDALASLAGELGEDLVLEHHSNLEVGKETARNRLATENWDAPLVVTTSVQFYESLFANRTSACRKLHNLAYSVIVLDEAQALPVDFLEPCLRALRELATNYGATVVLCTATQPAVQRRSEFPIGLDDVREIVPEPAALYASLRRVAVTDLGRQDDEQLSPALLAHQRVLCVVNTRKHARKLFEGIGEAVDGHFHLSALMCPEHRSEVFAMVRARLKDRGPCRVISTQLVEAGVDIDFPVVFRSLAGLDSIAQAAGRCNRNGLLPELGKVFVFRSEHVDAEKFLRETADVTEQVLPGHASDPLSLEAVATYFRFYYWVRSTRWDAKHILDLFQLAGHDRALPFNFSFAQVAERFELIEDLGKPVIVPWGERGRALVERLRRAGPLPDRQLLRRLQRFTVSAPAMEWNANVGGALELAHERYPVLVDQTCYSAQTGLSLPDPRAFLNA